MTVDEIKARQLAAQYLTRPGEMIDVAAGLCGVQAQFLPQALHGLAIRSTDFSPALAQARLVKNWTLRGTLHIFPEEDQALYLDPDLYRSHDWTIPDFWNSRPDWSLSPQRQELFTQVILNALSGGPCTREQLKDLCRDQGMTPAEEGSLFHPWGGGIRQLCQRGFLHYAVREEKTLCLSRLIPPLSREKSALSRVKRALVHTCPTTVHDLMYFFRASSTQVKGWLDQLPVRSVVCDGRTYLYLEDSPEPPDIPRCLFLAGFDQLLLSHEKKESLYLAPEHLRQVFSLAGIVSPTVLWDGNIAAKWQKKGHTVTVQPFVSLSASDRSAISQTAESLWPDLKQLKFS